MYIFFNPNIEITIKASSPEAIKKNKRIVKAIEIMIYLLIITSTVCGIYGNICIENVENLVEFDSDKMDTCKSYLYTELVFITITKLILSIM